MLRDELQRHSVEIDSRPLFSEIDAEAFRSGSLYRRTMLGRQARQRLLDGLAIDPAADTVLIQRQIDMFPTLTLEQAASDDRRLVYDVDDAIWFDWYGAGGHPLALLKGTARKARWLARHAAHVVAGNEILAEWLDRFAERVSVVPSVVDPTRVPLKRHEAREEIVLGWIGSHGTAPYLHRLEEPLRKLASLVQKHRPVLLAVGAEAPLIEGVEIRSLPWSEGVERAALQQMDIGLMPLPNNRWTRGKCGYKAVQYMSAGIPVVADDVGIASRLVGHGEAGLITRTPDEWVRGVAELASDPTLRARLGTEGRSRVERDYSTSRWGPVLASILRGG